MKKVRQCDICGSEYRAYRYEGRIFCRRHREQIKNYGKIVVTQYDKNEVIDHSSYAEIVLYSICGTEKARAKISVNRVEEVSSYRWYIGNGGYAIGSNGEEDILLHRLLTRAKVGEIVDHANRDKLDNRDENIRIATRSQNAMNTKLHSSNTSGVRGVYFDKARGKWAAEIIHNNKKKYLGRFASIGEAERVRKEAEEKYFGEFAPT